MSKMRQIIRSADNHPHAYETVKEDGKIVSHKIRGVEQLSERWEVEVTHTKVRTDLRYFKDMDDALDFIQQKYVRWIENGRMTIEDGLRDICSLGIFSKSDGLYDNQWSVTYPKHGIVLTRVMVEDG